MNERLIVKSFGPVRDLDITFKKVTLFIGDQGTGKSCVAKLFSMFKWLEKVLNQKKYKLNYFEQYNRFLTKLCSYHRIDSFIRADSYLMFESNRYDFVYSQGSFRIHEKHVGEIDLFRRNDENESVIGLSKIMYIPAERSIVSVAENKTKLLKELPDSSETFSDEFVNAKKFFKSGYELPFEGLHFEYDSLNEVGWISDGVYKVRLINASSGIQSSLPMCMVSEYLSKMIAEREEVKFSKEEKDKLEKRVAEIMQDDAISDSIKDMMIRQLSSANRYDRFINIVEEPELNLFPQSQMEVLRSLVAINSSSEQNMLVITTHSPYSLAILNTLIMGAEVYDSVDKVTQEEIETILPSCYHLHNQDVAAYRLSSKEEDYCVSIINSNTGMIAKNDLDFCSDEINRIFNQLYRLYANTFKR